LAASAGTGSKNFDCSHFIGYKNIVLHGKFSTTMTCLQGKTGTINKYTILNSPHRACGSTDKLKDGSPTVGFATGGFSVGAIAYHPQYLNNPIGCLVSIPFASIEYQMISSVPATSLVNCITHYVLNGRFRCRVAKCWMGCNT
jgi:hypothetical protein